MRLRNWFGVVVSVVLLMAAGTIGILVNRSALRAADTVHRTDSLALGVNNATLTGQMQLLSAAELNEFAGTHAFALGFDSAADRGLLSAFSAETAFFQYGMMLTALDGTPLTATRDTGLPPGTDPGWAPLRKLLAGGRPGFSSIMMVGDTALTAVAVPVLRDGRPVAVMVGFNEVAVTQLQNFVARLSASTHMTTIVDSTGRVAATSDPDLIGDRLDPALNGLLASRTEAGFVEYDLGRTRMIAVVVPGVPGGWYYVRTQTLASFDGAVHSRSQTLNYTLLSMLLIGVVGLSVLGYRQQVTRRRADEKFQALFQHAPDMVAVLDRDGHVAYASPSAGAILGVASGSMQSKSVFDLIHTEDRVPMRAQFDALVSESGSVKRLQCRVLRADGGFRWLELTASNQLDNPALAGVVINARDISDAQAFQEQLTHEAQHDPLTGLANRRRMQDVLDCSLRDQPVAVLFVDLDGFKPVNDAYGHEAGDELLRQVASRLSGCVRAEDVLSRVGGDEFVVLMPGVLTPAGADAMAARIRAATAEPFGVHGHDLTISASVGVHVAAPATDPDQALRAADHAMYAIKHAGGGRRLSVVAASYRGRRRADP